MEPVTTTIAVVSHAYHVLAGCIAAYQVISTAQRIGKDASVFRMKMRLEEFRLMQWAQKSGLGNDHLDERLNGALINEVLAQIEALLKDLQKLKDRYHLDLNPSPEISSTPIVPEPEPPQTLGRLYCPAIAMERERLLKYAKSVKSANSFPKRLYFAVKDKKGVGELIEQLAQYNNKLYDLLREAQQSRYDDDMRLIIDMLINLTSKKDELQVVGQSLTGVKNGEVASDSADLKSIRQELDPDAENAGTGAEDSERLIPPRLHFELLTDITDPNANSMRSLAKYDDATVFVEWKPHDSTTTTNSDGSNRILKRAEALAALLHARKRPEFHTLRCIGYISSSPPDSRIYFVYEIPTPPGTLPLPTSLFDLLSSNHTPSLTYRIRLAVELANCLRRLHTIGWLHKGLRSDNILFFGSASSHLRDFGVPYLTGFEYSRMIERPQDTERPPQFPAHEIYRHPDIQAEGSVSFKEIYDIYSLGIILLEIAQWKSLVTLLGNRIDWKACGTADVKKVKDILLGLFDETTSGSIGFSAGTIFQEVVRTCLAGDFDAEGKSPVGEKLRASYFTKVVKNLESCVI